MSLAHWTTVWRVAVDSKTTDIMDCASVKRYVAMIRPKRERERELESRKNGVGSGR
jgi:hypothetical protein